MKKNFIYLLLLCSLIAQAQITPSYPTIKLTKTTEGVKQDSLLVIGTDKIVKHIPYSKISSVQEFATASALPVTGIAGKIYLTKDNNKIYRWNGIFYQDLAVTDISGKVDKATGKSLLSDTEIARLATLYNYTHPANHPPSIITQDASNRFVTDVEKTAWNAKQGALGFTPENVANKQNSLAVDGTNTKYPTVTAVNTGLALKANLASPALTGTPTAPTATSGTNTNQIATTAFVNGAISTADSGNVKLTGAQTITGTKTFTGGGIFNTGGLIVNSFISVSADGIGAQSIRFSGNANNVGNISTVTLLRKNDKLAIMANENGGSQRFVLLDGANVTSFDKTFTFPNQTGTFAITNNPTPLTATSFIKSSTPTTNILLAGGGDIAQSDLPISSITQVALDLKENVANKATDFTMANNTLYPTVQAVKTYALNLINAKQAGAIGDGVADDTATLQAYLNNGQGTYIFPKSDYIVSGLDVNSDSKLIFEKGARLILKNNSDRPVLQNKNFSLNVDKNIEIYGLEIEGNEANQIKVGVLAPYTGEPTSGLRFFGVENLKIIGAKINKTRTYGIWISRVRNVIARDIEFNQSILTIDNQDGIHFNGLCYNLDISNIRGVTNDDMIALNANDVAQGSNVSLGEIKNATIRDVVFNNNLNGIRLLSAGNLLDKITIENLSGNVRDNVVAISSYALGTANFGSISIDNIKVDTNNPYNILGEYGGYILVNDKIDYLKISNVFRKTGADARPTVRIQSRADISKLVIDNITTKINPALTTYYPEISFESGSIVAQAFLSNVRLMNGVFPNGYAIGATGSTITRLHLENIYAEQIGYGLYLNNTDISTLFVNGTSTNFIRYPFYLVNDSDVGLAVIDNQKWVYSVSSPKVYNILDTSSIVFANSPVENSILKYDDTFNSISSTLKEIGSQLTNTSVGNGSALDLDKISGYGSSLTLRNSSVLSNAPAFRFYKPDNVSFYNIYTSSTGLETDGSVTASSYTATSLPVFENNVAASSLAVGQFYRTSTGVLMVKF